MKRSYTFWEIMDWDWLRDYATSKVYTLPTPFGEILEVLLLILRVVLIILTIAVFLALLIGSVVGILCLIILGEEKPAYGILGVLIAFVCLNVGNYLVLRNNGGRKRWYFWLCLIGGAIAAVWGIIIFIQL